MKNLINSSLLVICLLLFGFNAQAQLQETRPLPPFNKVKIGGGFEVEIIQGNEELMKIESEKLPLDKILSEVESDGTLKIFNKLNRKKIGEYWEDAKYMDGDNNNYYHSGKVKITLQFKNLEELSNAGSGKVYVVSPIKTNNFSLRNSGSGLLQMTNLSTGFLKVSSAGSGNIKILSGTCQSEEVKISGSGDIDLVNLNAQSSSSRISGSGKIIVNVSDALEASISGSGSINYKGNPAKLLTKTSGSGSIRKLN